jgi:probable HAF family extracellular repeat protein
MTTRRLATLGVALALGAIAAAPAAAGGGYTITDLGTFGGTFSSASAVNDSAVVVGQAEYPNGDGHALLYKDSLPLKDLGTLGGSYSYANDVNANAEVVGDATDGAGNVQGFRWLGAGVLQLIPTLGGVGGSAFGVNDAGAVVGISNTSSGALHGYLYDGSLTDVSLILAPLGATKVFPYAVNASKEVVGSRWQDVQPRAREQNAFLKAHSWEEYAAWHLGLTEGAAEETKARYAFVYGNFRRLHRMG